MKVLADSTVVGSAQFPIAACHSLLAVSSGPALIQKHEFLTIKGGERLKDAQPVALDVVLEACDEIPSLLEFRFTNPVPSPLASI